MQKILFLIAPVTASLQAGSAFAATTDFGAAAARVETTMMLLVPLVALLSLAYMVRLAVPR